MVLDQETFTQRLQEHPDTDYIKALLHMARGWSQQWVIDALEAELAQREKVHTIVVGNIGTVYAGTNRGQAEHAFESYMILSQQGVGRAANEPVTWMIDNDIYCELEV